MVLVCFPDVPHHSAEVRRRSGVDVRGDGLYIHELAEQPGSHPLVELCLPFPQTTGLLGQRPGPQDLLFPGLPEKGKNKHGRTHTHTHMGIIGTANSELCL